MTTITFNGGPFDGEVMDMGPVGHADETKAFGCIRQSDNGAGRARYVVYLPDGRGGVVFHAYTDSINAGMAMLDKERNP